MRPFSWTEPTLLGDCGLQVWWLGPPEEAAGDPDWDEAGDRALLDPAEIRRARRFHRDVDRVAFIRRRAFLRRVLGELTGVDPGALEFGAGPFGKPFLRTEGPRFNQSRSCGASLLVTSPSHAVGVDLERVAPRTKLEAVAARVQSEGEAAQWEGLPREEHERAFFRLWTRKEAVMKVTGEGFQREAASFSVGMEERLGQEPALVELGGWGAVAVVDLPIPAPFRAALAVLLTESQPAP